MKVSFSGQREDKNNVDKLRSQTNALNFNNQRNIKQSIENLSKDSKNAEFLMNVAEQIKYGMRAEIKGAKPNNNWMEQLKQATEKCIENNNTATNESLKARFKEVFENNKTLTEQEKNVLALRESLLNTPRLQNEIKTSENENIRDIEKNINYFVVSSEVSIDEKAQVLEKLNKFMSPEYKIDEQLKDKKAQVLGEVMNDIVVKRADQDRPTIKEVDQRHHGMCAAISLARKTMAYEYKPQYIDMIMQEFSASPEMEVYDISKLGTGAKTTIPKTHIDYAYAEEKGYRLIDASTLQWMNAAGTAGKGDDQATVFSAFDKEYFDTFHDSFWMKNFDDPVLASKNTHLRALTKADEKAGSTIKTFETRAQQALMQMLTERQNAEYVAQSNRALANNLKPLMPEADAETIHKTVSELTHLNQDKNAKFYIVDAEEDITKKQKIAKFIESKNPAVDKELLNSKLDDIFNLYSATTETLDYMNKEIEPKSAKAKMTKYYKPLYETAAMYRSAVELGLDVESKLQSEIKRLNLADDATKEDVLKKMEDKGELVPEDVLRGLQDKYNKIAKYGAVVEKAEVKGDHINIKGVYDVSKKEALALENVKENLKNISEALSAEKKALAKELDAPLAKLAEQTGTKSGNYWVSEGSSGLNRAAQIRIFEYMTGTRGYEETDIDNILNIVKRSNHSGISATNVYHNDHGWHAMYMADIAPVQVKDPKTGEMVTKDAIMHDNSWGYAEKKNNWIDSNGLERTDYACGRGGSTGYITNDLWQNGTLADDFKTKPGNANGYVYRMLTGAVLPASTTLAAGKAEEILNTLITGGKTEEQRLNVIEDAIKNGELTPDDISMMQLRNDAASKLYALEDKSNKKVWASINSKEDWDKLADNDPAKLLMEKAAISYSLDSQTMNMYAMNVESVKDLKKADKMLQAVALKEFVETIKTTGVEEFDLKNYQVQHNVSGYGNNKIQLVKDWIDNKFDPADNAEFISKLYELKAMSAKELEAYVKQNSTNEDLGINRISGYEMLQEFKHENPEAKRVVSHLLNMDVLNNTIGFTKEGKSPMEMYFMLGRAYDNLDLTNQVKPHLEKNKAQGYRPGFTNFSLYNESAVKAAANQVLAIAGQNTLKIMALTDEAQKEKNVNLLNRILTENINTSIDAAHRNNVMNTLKSYMTEVRSSGLDSEKSLALAQKFETEFDRYSLLKNPKAILNEYLMLTAAGENSAQTKGLRTLLSASMLRADGAKMTYSVMDAISKGKAHEIGQQILDSELVLTKNGKKEVVKISDDPAYLYELSENAISMTNDAASAAFIFNSIALSDKVMEAINDSLNFDNLLEGVKSGKVHKAVYAQFIQTKLNFVKNLNLSKSPIGEQARQMFYKKCTKFVQELVKTA